MHPLPSQCPICGGDVVVTQINCRDCNTTIDGQAYDLLDGRNTRDTNSILVGNTGKVGTGADGVADSNDEVNLNGVDGPELEIVANLADRIASLQRSISRYRVEIQKKYSIPFACIVFVLLGIPLGLSTRKGSAGIALGVSLLVILAYYLFLIAGEQLADRRMMPPFLSMWLPNIILGAFGVVLTARSLHEGNPLPLGRLLAASRSFFTKFRDNKPGTAGSLKEGRSV